MMAMRAVDHEEAAPSQCWCCGRMENPAKMVRLGDHPEVGVCLRCAHSLSKWAWEIEDQSRSGPAVRVREGIRRLRKTVVRHGWHHNKVVGRALRWLGRFTP